MWNMKVWRGYWEVAWPTTLPYHIDILFCISKPPNWYEDEGQWWDELTSYMWHHKHKQKNCKISFYFIRIFEFLRSNALFAGLNIKILEIFPYVLILLGFERGDMYVHSDLFLQTMRQDNIVSNNFSCSLLLYSSFPVPNSEKRGAITEIRKQSV